MREIVGDLWEYHEKGFWVAVTTNGMVGRAGQLVMGRGTAKGAKDRFPGIDKTLGDLVLQKGNIPFFFPGFRIVSFPVKHAWYEPADLPLVERSAKLIAKEWKSSYQGIDLYMGRPGCGNGKLKWSWVQPIIEDIFNEDCFVVCEINPK